MVTHGLGVVQWVGRRRTVVNLVARERGFEPRRHLSQQKWAPKKGRAILAERCNSAPAPLAAKRAHASFDLAAYHKETMSKRAPHALRGQVWNTPLADGGPARGFEEGK